MTSSALKFAPLESFSDPNQGYNLLPFRLLPLDHEGRYVITNLVGEFLVLTRNELNAFVHNDLSQENDLYRDLKSKHFLIDADSDVGLELLSLKYRTRALPISYFTSLHMFVVSLRCDHSCPYCQVSRRSEDKSAFDMTEETALRGLDFTFKSPSPSIKIEFQGGEALLNFDLVKFIVKEALRRNEVEKRDLAFVIATNLSKLTDEILSFCKEHNVFISTSLDGPADLHNANRPRPGNDSYELTIQGIAKVKDTLGPDQVSALMTTTVKSLSRVEEIIDEYVRLGFNGIFLRPLSPYGFAIKTKSYASYAVQEWLEFYKQGLEYIIKLNEDGIPFKEHYTSLLLSKMFSPYGTRYVDLQSPAGIGISAISFNYDGDVYVSDEARMLAEMKDKTFCLGNLHQNSYEEIMLSNKLLDPLEQSLAESSPMCSDCAFLPYCGSDPVFHHATQGDFVGKKYNSAFCTRNMELNRHIIRLLNDNERYRRVLMKWVQF